MIRAALVVFAVATVFFAPVSVIVLANIAAAFVSPLVPIASGVLVDALYRSPIYSGIPWGTLLGLSMAGIAFGVRKLLAARIMGV